MLKLENPSIVNIIKNLLTVPCLCSTLIAFGITSAVFSFTTSITSLNGITF